MFVLNGSQKHWTGEMEDLFLSHGEQAPTEMLTKLRAQLADMVILVRGELTKAARNVVGSLTVIDVHARDVIIKLEKNKVSVKTDFLWSSQLRYYWEDDDLWADMVAARRPYGYEYLGNTFRLVITPLTDKCYLTLIGALSLTLGGAPAGPAGTGKTETTKDLGKALAMQCVVFNCSDGLDFIAMGKFFKGLASCGAWACFDEFNRINIEVLSVIGQQIATIQLALKRKDAELFFEGSQITLDDGFGVFITMNPGYAGRSALPDSLSALFRPVAMMVPDYALIGEIMFFAYGFEYAKECGAKMVTTFKLCSEQLSSQPHYDYGMRAVKTTITAAGNLKRAEPDGDEMVLLLRALQDVNIPKFLAFDLPLFAGIISDLFPGKKRPTLDYGSLFGVMKNVLTKNGLQALPWFVGKVIELYEMIVVRHGLMLVGPTGGGKSSNLKVLKETLTQLKKFNIPGFAYENVIVYQLNPKSITMGQMYGEFDPNTHEWQDGIMSTMYRLASSSPTPERKWMLFDGPVDAIWIENMNTVLDDNKKLCLNSGEIVKMSAEMTMMFEVEDLAVASPATVSRVGIIYMEPASLGCEVLLRSWIEKLPPGLKPATVTKLRFLFDQYMESGTAFLRSNLKELAPTCNNNLAQSLMRILDCYMERYYIKEGRDDPTDSDFQTLGKQIEHLFFFALVWSVGCTTNEKGRAAFDGWLRSEMESNSQEALFPNEGMVYDYSYDLENSKWVYWMNTIKKYEIDPKASFAELVVPTNDSVRNNYLMDLLLMKQKHVLMVGETGTGKTINISQYILGQSKIGMMEKPIDSNCIPVNIAFSAQTSQNMTQDMLDAKMEKRRKGIFGPAAGKQYIVYVDDLNMPKREEYGAQPPIEILRQWFDQSGWYDRKELTFRTIIDLTFICSMGPPGGGRQDVTARFLRHFNMIGYVELSDASKAIIFETILGDFLGHFEARVDNLVKPMVSATIDLFNNIIESLLPTPAKSHYTFNLRDLAKVFQGTLMCEPKKVTGGEDVVRVWVHECKRVFADRLTNATDHEWFEKTTRNLVSTKFEMDYDEIVNVERLIYGDYMIRGADPRLYEQVTDMAKLKLTIEEYLEDYNTDQRGAGMPLVMFMDAIEHVSKIARVLRQPMGNCLLLGVGGSGRQSMTKLATYVSGFKMFQVEIVKGYGMAEWREDVKNCLLVAGTKNVPTTFLFSDTQIVDETMLEDINGILNAGDIPNLYNAEDLDAISSACRVDCQRKQLPPTKINIFNQYLLKVRANIHVCLAMSPLGEVFRDRLRMFPSLVNCCTIDWFTEWPAEALQGVGMSQLQDSGMKLDNMEGIVEMFRFIHQSVEQKSKEFLEILRRHAYVTPTSYLELLGSFKTLYAFKKDEVGTKANRLQIGLDKLASTKSMVGGMKEELAILKPQLVQTTKEVEEMMVHIAAEKEEADKVKAKVEVEEKIATEKATKTQAIKDDAQKDLDEALPALDEAVKCLDALKKSDIDEVKSLKTPPSGVVLTLKVTCMYFGVKPNKKNDPDNPGKKIEDWFGAGKDNLLTNAGTFMDSLKKYDKDNIPNSVIKKVEPFMTDEAFTPKMIEKASKACTAICMWARAMYKYHTVAISVAPKKAALAEAQAELDVVMAQLAEKQSSLAKIINRLAELEANYEASVKKLESLKAQATKCEVQLANADKLIGGLGGEEIRWKETVAVLSQELKNVIGNILVSAGTVSYLGPFTTVFRNDIVTMWHETLVKNSIPHTPGCNIINTLSIPVVLRGWQLAGLPTDQLSTENGLIMDKSRRWPLFIDPQAQANRYVKNLGKDKERCLNGMDVIKLTDKNFLRGLINGVRFGKWVLLENIKEELDASLEPILLQQTFKQGGQDMMKIGEDNVPYDENFRFYITTKMPNPHYAPEVQVKVSLLNFSITQIGLEEQLLNVVVEEEMPELSEQRTKLMIENAAMDKQMYDIESQILKLLSESTGNILDDTVLIETLADAKKTSNEIAEKMEEAKVTEAEIFSSSEEYRPVANRASLLYFCISDFATVDPMYQYSL
jgi:dynein heavy chain